MSTIKDIAKETGLGIATISSYLNNKNVRPYNKVLIEEAIKKLDFKVNELARSIKTGKSKLIGIIIPEISNQFITIIISKMEDILRQNGYGCIVTDSRIDENIEKEAFDFLVSRQVDGIILMPTATKLPMLSSKDIPIIILDREIDIDGCHFVGVDNIEAGKKGTNILIEAGHKNIGIVTGSSDIVTAKNRLLGYRIAHEEMGLEVLDSNIVYTDYSINEGYNGFKRLLEQNKDITAVFLTNYELTVGGMIAVNELGLNVPNDISIVGFDNVEFSKAIKPNLTIITQPIDDIAYNTANLMLESIANETIKRKVILKTDVSYGRSVALI